jgi:amino acid adenylation domain-containing protein
VTGLLHERFLASAQAAPRAVAIDAGPEPLTYGECAAWALALADALARELPAGSRVGLVLPKGPEAIVTMLACLMAGVAYVPLDASAPPERQLRATRVGLQALVADDAVWGRWRATGLPLPRLALRLDRAAVRALRGGAGVARPPRAAAGDDLAYVLSTSGSTGTPKGVAITHLNAAHFVDWAVRRFELTPADRLAVHAPLHFDLPVLDVYAGLAAGAAVCPIDERTVLFPRAVTRFLAERRISVLYAVPSAYVALLERGGLAPGEHDLRLLLYAGEELHVPQLARLVAAAPGARVFNLYGPIETNVVTAHEVAADDLRREHVPIGRAIDGIDVILRDGDDAVVSRAGALGEICVAGPQLSPGYLEGGAPVSRRVSVDGRDWYPTGDHARWSEDGELVFAGRRDGLVKTRGFRVEVGDVEAALLRHEGVSQAVVYPVEDRHRATLLHAVVVTSGATPADPRELAAWCRRLLPGYMVPAHIEALDELHYTATGKVDRNALRAAVES